MALALGGAMGLGVVVFVTLILLARPGWMFLERAAYKNSHQYIEAKESMLLTWVMEYRRLDAERLQYEARGELELARAIDLQQEALKDKIRVEAGRVPPGGLPREVQLFLEEHS